MSYQQLAAGYNGDSGLWMPPTITADIELEYYCGSPLSDMANWNADSDGSLICAGMKKYYETSEGLSADEACDDTNGQVTYLHQNFRNNSLELCGERKYTVKKDEAEAIRQCARWAAQQGVLNEDLKRWLEKQTVPYAIATLMGSAHPLSQGHNAIGVVNTAGIPNGLGSLENPLKVDVTTPRNGGNTLQAGTLTTKALIARLRDNMFAQGVLCSPSDLMVFGGSGLDSGFGVDEMCENDCTLIQSRNRYKISTWAFSAINGKGETVHYVAMFDTNKFWFSMHQLYLKWVQAEHYQSLTGATIWGAKVNNPRAVSIAAVQYV
jgi:hypothetical protein